MGVHFRSRSSAWNLMSQHKYLHLKEASWDSWYSNITHTDIITCQFCIFIRNKTFLVYLAVITFKVSINPPFSLGLMLFLARKTYYVSPYVIRCFLDLIHYHQFDQSKGKNLWFKELLPILQVDRNIICDLSVFCVKFLSS